MNNSQYNRPVKHFEFSTKVSTNYISHFTPEFKNLLGIIDFGFIPKANNEFQIYKQDYLEHRVLKAYFTLIAGGSDKIESLNHEVTMSCFCDIQHKAAKKHRQTYGKYCIAMTKQWALAYGFSPVIYVPDESKVQATLYNIVHLKEKLKAKSKDNADLIHLSQLIDSLFEFVKPYKDNQKHYKFYDEREWRYTPISGIPFDSSDTNKYLTFNGNDFHFAIVQNSKEKKLLLSRLREKFGYISSKRIKIKKI